MYNIFVFPLEILLNLIVLFLIQKNPPQDVQYTILRRI